jgi:hypothetical protein
LPNLGDGQLKTLCAIEDERGQNKGVACILMLSANRGCLFRYRTSNLN